MTATMHWVDTKTDDEARALDRGMWDVATHEGPDGTTIIQAPGPAPENGEFWSHALDRIKDDPDQRYAMARRHLPAAWREMAISLRTKIRNARKAGTEYQDLLRELHHLAAMSSYAGYGIIERLPYARLASLDLSYDRIGFERLDLLGVTDGKWMRELWGEPSDHSTAAELYEDMLAADLARLDADRKREDAERMNRFLDDWNREDEVEAPPTCETAPPARRGLVGWLFRR